MTIEEAINFAEYAQIMADGKPDVQEFYKLAESALWQQETVIKCHDLFDEDGGEITHVETVTNRNGLNEPLTLDELRQMDGEPVWIKLFDPDEEFWVLRNEWVDTRNPEPMILLHMRWYSHADYGKTWLAYRQKPEEDVSDTDVVKWISIKDRLPEHGTKVLVCDVNASNRYVGVWIFEKDPDDDSDCWEEVGGWWQPLDAVTHWMPLPEPPEEGTV